MEPRPFPSQPAENVQSDTDPATFADMGNYTGLSFYGAPPPIQCQEEEPEETAPETIQAKCSECEAESPEPTVQRREEEEDGSDESVPVQPMAEEGEAVSEDEIPLQAKLSVGKPGDKYEQEADNMAARVMAMGDPSVPQEEMDGETVQGKPLAGEVTPLVQRRQIQRKGNKDASPSIERQLRDSGGGGRPLADGTRSFMESRFGADFSGVRVHTDSSAVQMTQSLGAQAFTHGQDIYYGKGKSPGKNDLTAHELTHTIQQTGGKQIQSKANKLRLKADTDSINNIQPFQRLRPKRAASLRNVESENDSQGKDRTSQQTKPEQQLESKQDETLNRETTLKQSANPQEFETEKTSTPEAVSDEQTQQTQALKSQAPTAAQTEDVNSQKAEQAKPQQTQGQIIADAQTQTGASALKPKNGSAKPEQSQDGVVNPATLPEAAQNVAGKANSSPQNAPAQQPAADSPPAGDPLKEDMKSAAASATDQAASGSVSGSRGGAAVAGGTSAGGGGAIADKVTPTETPDVSQSEPSAALAAVSNLPPAQLQSALGSVTAAVSNNVSQQKAELAANPPQADTPTGSEKPAVAKAAPAGGEALQPLTKTAEGEEKPVPEPEPLPPEKAPPKVITPSPVVRGNEEGNLSDADASSMKASLKQLPTSDPGVNGISAGSTPKLALEGNADPKKAQEQRAELETSLTEAKAKGQQELAQPTGVEEIQSTLPQQTLTAKMGGSAGSGGAGSGGGATTTAVAAGDGLGDAASIFAQQEKGGEIQAAVAKAQGDLAAKKQEHAAKVTEEQATARQDIEQLKQQNTEQQAQERTKAQGEVANLQSQWGKEQDALVSQSRKDADTVVGEGLQDVQTKQAQGEAAATQEIQQGEANAQAERQKGEAKAAAEKKKGEEQSSGLFSSVVSQARAFFDGIKKAIEKAFEAARAAMRKAIEVAKKLAKAAIEKCRKAIVAVICRVGDALIALGDTLLAKWPGLRDKWRNSIEKRVQQAEDAVNKLAQKLNQGIQKTLDGLGSALDAGLGLLEKGMLGVVSVCGGVVMGAIKFGEGVAQSLGAFAVLAKDIAANPGQWMSNLGGAVSDGIQNHLWGAFQEQVQAWFNQKLQTILGLGSMIWKVLTEGGISMAEIGKMAWTAVKQALPTIIIGVLLKRLVSMIVPAAGAVLAIIQGLQAAWGTVSQIIQAFGRFMTFLKAVKTGSAGPQFGALLASAAIVLLEFITNFIIVKIAKAARKVAGKLKGLAKSVMKRLKRKKGKKDQKIQDKHKKDESQNSKKQAKLDKAVSAIKPKAEKLLKRGTSKTYLKAKLLFWKVRYGLSSLTMSQSGNLKATVNPSITLDNPKGKTISDSELGRLLMPIFARAEKEYEQSLLKNPITRREVDQASQRWSKGESGSLEGLSRFKQQMIIRNVQAPKGKREVEPGTQVFTPNSSSKGKVENLGKYKEILRNLKRKTKQYDVDESILRSILTSRSSTIEPKLKQLETRLEIINTFTSHPRTRRLTKKKQQDIRVFLNELRRTSFLTQAFEPARVPGISTATAVSSTMLSQGMVRLEQVISPEGNMAPMTPVGAAPESGKAESPAQKKAEKIRYRRVGRIFGELLDVAKTTPIIVAEGNYDLRDLASAVRVWLEERKRKMPNPEDLAAAETLLKAEINSFLISYHGKGQT